MSSLQIRHRCPHCSELTDFSLSQFSEVTSGPAKAHAKALWDHEGHGMQYTKRQAEIVATGCGLARCPMCNNPVMFVVSTTPNQMRAVLGINSDRQNYGRAARSITDFNVDITYPTKPALTAHPTWPSEIAAIFNETRQFLREGRRPFFVLAGCRSTLDVVTKKLGATKGSLKQRIDELQQQGVITKTLADWAHALRLDGNEALHEGEISDSPAEMANAIQYVAFLELLLHMSFELAQAITEQRKPLTGGSQ